MYHLFPWIKIPFIYDPIQQAVVVLTDPQFRHLIHLVMEAPSAVGVPWGALVWATNTLTLCVRAHVPATHPFPTPLVTDFPVLLSPGLDYLDKP